MALHDTSYATGEELAEFSRIGDNQDHNWLDYAVSSASRDIDHFCGRAFGLDDEPVERLYRPKPDYIKGWWTVDIDDLASSPVTVTVNGNEVDTFELGPVNAVANGRVWTRLSFTSDSEYRPTCPSDQVAVTAAFGWPTVPDAIHQAALFQGSRLLKRREAPFGISGSPEFQGELRLLNKLDVDAELLSKAFKRMMVIR